MGIQSFQIATPTPIQTNPVQGNSIAQMVNAANGIQAYKQAQQLNPLQLQQAQMAIEQAQQINPLAVKEAEAKLETAQTGAQQSKQNYLVSGEDYARKMINALPPIDDYVDKNGEVNQKALTRSLDIVRKSTEAVGLPKHPSNLLGQLEDAVTKKDYNRYEELRNRVAGSSASPSEQFASKFPNVQFQNLGGTVQPVTTGNPKIAETAPGTKIGAGLPIGPSPMQPGVTTVNGIIGQYDSTGKFVPFNVQPGQQPGNLSMPGMVQTPAPSAVGQNKMPSIVKIDNFSAPGQQNTQEVARYNAGQADFNAANERATLAQDSALTAQNIKKNLSAAAGSTPGRVLRSIGQTVIGDPQLDILVKSLADQQLRQSQLMGLKNQAAEADQRTAGGSSEITAEALAHIVERAEATNLAATKYNQALSKMQEKYGKERTYLNNDNFKNAWANSYNPIAFIIQNTNRQNIPQKDKDKIIDYYTHDMSRDQLDTLANNMKNLKRLERGDF